MIKSCRKCSHSDTQRRLITEVGILKRGISSFQHICKLTGRELYVDELDKITNWCPLRDYKEFV